MKESSRAARDEDAQKRLVAWAERNASEEDVERLKGVRFTRRTPSVAATEQREILAEILEANEANQSGDSSSSESSGSRKRSATAKGRPKATTKSDGSS